jgi:hypothetical protein
MLDWESQCLDLEEGGLTEQTIDVNAQPMRSQFGVETSAQAPKGMGMIDFNIVVSPFYGLCEIFEKMTAIYGD